MRVMHRITLALAFPPVAVSSFLVRPHEISSIGSTSIINTAKVRDILPTDVLDFDLDTLPPVAKSKEVLGELQTGVDATKEVIDSVQQWKALTAETYADNAGQAIVDLLGGVTDKLQEYYPVFKEIGDSQEQFADEYQQAITRAKDQGQAVYESIVPESLRNGGVLGQIKKAQDSVVGPYNQAITKLVADETYQPAKQLNDKIASAYEGGITGTANGISSNVLQPTYNSLIDQSIRNKGIAEGYQRALTGTQDNFIKPTGVAIVNGASNLKDLNRASVAPAYENFITKLVDNPVVEGLSKQATSALASTQTAQESLAGEYQSGISKFAQETVIPVLDSATGQVKSLLAAVDLEAAQLKAAESYNEFVTQGYKDLLAYLQTTYASSVEPTQLDIAKQYNQFITEKSAELVGYIGNFDIAALPSQLDQIWSSLPQ